MTPDSPLVRAVQPSPNHGERKNGCRPDMLLLHYTGMDTAAAALARLCDPASQVSSHYVVDEDGQVIQLVPENRRAWHAGAAVWAGCHDVNSCSVGIELVHPGHQGGLPGYPAAQIAAVIRLGRDIVERWAIRPERVLGHSDVAPDRKEDPGETFPWVALHEAGLGHWVPAAPIRGGRTLEPGDEGREVGTLQDALALYGYALDPTGRFDERTGAVVTAFQRHFRPGRVDGIADLSTLDTLRALLASRPPG